MKTGVIKLTLFASFMFPSYLLADGYGARTHDQGLDGTIRYYNVVCPSKERTALTYNIRTKETCVTYVKGEKKEVCKLNWDKDKAAKEACN